MHANAVNIEQRAEKPCLSQIHHIHTQDRVWIVSIGLYTCHLLFSTFLLMNSHSPRCVENERHVAHPVHDRYMALMPALSRVITDRSRRLGLPVRITLDKGMPNMKTRVKN